MYNIVVLARRSEEGMRIKALLQYEGIGRVEVVTDVAQAIHAVSREEADCLFLDRGIVPGLHTLFDQFQDPSLLFVSMRDTADDMDAINCLNSRRFAAYLTYPVSREDVHQALDNLEWPDKEHRRVRRTAAPSEMRGCG